MKQCKICKTDLENIRKLSKHIRDKHKSVTVKQYYDEYLKKESEGICVICGKETRYVGLNAGYVTSCAKGCSAKLFRKRLREDAERHEIFKEKVKENMKRIWEEREHSGEKQIILDKSEDGKQKTLSKMTKKERKEKYGWLNKLSGSERQNKIDEIMSPLVKYWENITDEQITYLYHKRMNTIVKNSENAQIPEHLLELSEETIKSLDKIFGIS